MKNLIATEGRLLIKVKPEENKTSGGILLARPTNPELMEGTVVSVGLKRDKAKQEFQEGQTVYWQSNLGMEITLNGEKHLLINQENIVAIEAE